MVFYRLLSPAAAGIDPAMQIKANPAFAIPPLVHLGQDKQAIVVQAVFGSAPRRGRCLIA